MTIEQLNATPLYSKVTYEGTTAVIIKIKNGKAILFDASLGWQSFDIPADYLTLVEAYLAPPMVKTGSIATAPLYYPVTVGGKKGVIIDKRVTLNTFTGVDYWTAFVWFSDTETIAGVDDTTLQFDDVTNYPAPDGTPGPRAKNNLLLYAAIAVGAYLLFIKKKEPTA